MDSKAVINVIVISPEIVNINAIMIGLVGLNAIIANREIC